MMSSDKFIFTKENIDSFLKELGKEYRKLSKQGQNVELIIVGGVAAIVNYDFRETTTDIDALFHANSIFKEAIRNVGDKYGLPDGWLNSDFKYTASYSDKLVEHSKYYKTFYSLDVRTVSGEYAIAMKLVSDRNYKSDISDIVGIIKDERKRGNEITFEKIDKAMVELYSNWKRVSDSNLELLNEVLKCKDLEQIYIEKVKEESLNRNYLEAAIEEYKDVITSDNTNDFIKFFKGKE